MLKPNARVAVIGAGIVGACIALQLRRSGFTTLLFDPQEADSAASYGNAGLISVDSCIPIALPGLLRQVPKWLLDPRGPLVVRVSHLPHVLPYLWQRFLGSSMRDVLRVSDAMVALHRHALLHYRELLGTAFHESVRECGQVHVWTRAARGEGADVEAQLRERQGVASRWLTRAELESVAPGIAPAFQRALFFPRNAHTVDPKGLVLALLDNYRKTGGGLINERVSRLAPTSGGAWQITTPAATHPIDAVVVANGIAARDLVRPLGLKLPLLAERGYHVQLRDCPDGPTVPVVYRDKGVVATPMSQGLRLAGMVEIAEASSPPDERRTAILLDHARAMFPALQLTGRLQTWMGVRPSTPDGLPIIDSVAALPGLWLACGHSHFGMTGAPMTSRIVACLLMDKAPEIDCTPYRLSRFH